MASACRFMVWTFQALLIIIMTIDCKTVLIFAYSSTREQSNKRSGMRLKTESETGETLPFSLLILRKKPTVLQSTAITIIVIFMVV